MSGGHFFDIFWTFFQRQPQHQDTFQTLFGHFSGRLPGSPKRHFVTLFGHFSRERRAKGSRLVRLQPGPGRSPRTNPVRIRCASGAHPTYRFYRMPFEFIEFLSNFYRIAHKDVLTDVLMDVHMDVHRDQQPSKTAKTAKNDRCRPK